MKLRFEIGILKFDQIEAQIISLIYGIIMNALHGALIQFRLHCSLNMIWYFKIVNEQSHCSFYNAFHKINVVRSTTLSKDDFIHHLNYTVWLILMACTNILSVPPWTEYSQECSVLTVASSTIRYRRLNIL